MKQIIVKLIAWIDAGVDAKTKVTVGILIIGVYLIGVFALGVMKEQRNDAIRRSEDDKEHVIYLRKKVDTLEKKLSDCNHGWNEDLRSSAERSQRQKERSDSINNIIKSFKK